MMGVLPGQATVPAPAAICSQSSKPLAILRTPCSIRLAPQPAEPPGNEHQTCPWSQLPVGPNRWLESRGNRGRGRATVCGQSTPTPQPAQAWSPKRVTAKQILASELRQAGGR